MPQNDCFSKILFRLLSLFGKKTFNLGMDTRRLRLKGYAIATLVSAVTTVMAQASACALCRAWTLVLLVIFIYFNIYHHLGFKKVLCEEVCQGDKLVWAVKLLHFFYKISTF